MGADPTQESAQALCAIAEGVIYWEASCPELATCTDIRKDLRAKSITHIQKLIGPARADDHSGEKKKMCALQAREYQQVSKGAQQLVRR